MNILHKGGDIYETAQNKILLHSFVLRFDWCRSFLRKVVYYETYKKNNYL